jgi:hypothetical protein
MVSDLSHKGKKLIKLNTRNWHPVVRVLYKIKKLPLSPKLSHLVLTMELELPPLE